MVSSWLAYAGVSGLNVVFMFSLFSWTQKRKWTSHSKCKEWPSGVCKTTKTVPGVQVHDAVCTGL